MCAHAHSTGAEALTATVTNTGPTVMSKRTATIALATAALTIIGSTASAGAHEVVRCNAEVQPGTIVVKTAERRLYLVLSDGSAIRYPVAVGRPGKQWEGTAQGAGKRGGARGRGKGQACTAGRAAPRRSQSGQPDAARRDPGRRAQQPDGGC